MYFMIMFLNWYIKKLYGSSFRYQMAWASLSLIGPIFCQRFAAHNSDEDSLQSKSKPSKNIPGKPLVRNQVEENEDRIWFLSPFVFYDDERHIIDNVAKLLFPLLFLILNAIYFLFHRFHPDTIHLSHLNSQGII